MPVRWNVVPNGAQRDRARDTSARPRRRFPTVVYRRYTPRLGKPMPNQPGGRGRQRRHSGPAHPGARRRQDRRPLQEPRQRVRAAALDALPRRPLPRSARTARTCRGSRARARASSRATRSRTGSTRGPTRRACGRTTTTRRRWPTRSRAASTGRSRSWGRDERPPDREFVVFFSQHLDFMTINGRAFVGNTPVLPREGRRPRAVGRAHDR